MIFIGNAQKHFSTNHKLHHHERCAQFCVVAALLLLVLVGVFLYLGITSQYSEQKTVFYILFAVCVLAFIGVAIFTVYQVFALSDKKRKRDAILSHQSSTNRYAYAAHANAHSMYDGSRYTSQQSVHFNPDDFQMRVQSPPPFYNQM